MAVSGHSWTTDFVGDIVGSPAAATGDPGKLFADVEIAPSPTPAGVASVVRVVAAQSDWPSALIGSTNARVHVVGALWTTGTGLIRCTPTSILKV
jgi:hypothetical protein